MYQLLVILSVNEDSEVTGNGTLHYICDKNIRKLMCVVENLPIIMHFNLLHRLYGKNT